MRLLHCTLAFAALSLAMGCTISADDPEPNSPSGETGVPDVQMRLDLQSTSAIIKLGDHPDLKVFLVNDGSKAVTLVLPGDGSDCGWRTPVIRWKPEQKRGGRCGNINPLTASEIVKLEPGKRLELTSWIGRPTLSEVGTHQVSLEFENIPDHKWRGIELGPHDPAALALVRQSTPFKAVSNVVQIEVKN